MRQDDRHLDGDTTAVAHDTAPLRPESAEQAERTSGVRRSVWLWTIVGAALLLRFFALLTAMRRDPHPWVDPDDFLNHARALAAQGWDLRPFMYARLVKAPLYPLFLWVFTFFPTWYELSAALVQIALGTAAVAALYVICREVHSSRAGVIAAAVYAVWLPSLAWVHLFLQEQLHVPLVIAGLALLVRAAARSAPPIQFGIAGVVLGLAALARSMPLYYIGPAALLYIVLVRDRRPAARQALALVLAFLVVILPWCVYVSAKMGHVILIDNMGSAAFGMTYREVRPEVHTAPPPTVIDSLRMLWLAASRQPVRFFGDRAADFQRLFRLVGGQWLVLQRPVASRTQALALNGVAHSSDLLFALSAVLAPLGVVLARRRREVILVGLWVALHLGLLVVFAWNGVRYRAPYEPLMIGLAAVVLAGGWARPKPLALGLALAASLAMGAAVAVSLPETAAERATYGFHEWSAVAGTHQASVVGEAGFSVFTVGGLVKLKLSSPQSTPAGAPVRVRVFLAGRRVDVFALDAGERQLQYAWAPPIAYVELRATFENGRPAPLLVDVLALRH